MMKYVLFNCCIAFVLFLVACKPASEVQSNKKKSTHAAQTETTNSKGKSIQKIVSLAESFKATLKDDQLAAMQLAYSRADAAKWSNFPASFRNAQRVGLNFGAMTATQLEAAKALLKEVAGTTVSEGYDELQQLLNADDYLKANGGGYDYGTANYYIALLGTPATTGTFEIQFGGHHLAFANTYKDGVLAGATPSFRGVEPFGTFTQNGTTNQPMNQEQAALSAMLNALTPTELTAAKLSRTFSDLLVGPQRDGAFPATPSGVPCSALSSTEKKLVLAAITTYVNDIDDADAAIIMKRYTSQLDSTYISYSGTTGMTTRNDYVRIDGPSIWIEYSSQGGIVLRGTHPHSVWRDKLTDYGGK